MTGLVLELPAGLVVAAGGGAADSPVDRWWEAWCAAASDSGADLVAVGRLVDGPVVVLTVGGAAELAQSDDVEDVVGAVASRLADADHVRAVAVDTGTGRGVLLRRRVLVEHTQLDGAVGGGQLDVVQVVGPGRHEHAVLVLTGVSPAGGGDALAAAVTAVAASLRRG